MVTGGFILVYFAFFCMFGRFVLLCSTRSAEGMLSLRGECFSTRRYRGGVLRPCREKLSAVVRVRGALHVNILPMRALRTNADVPRSAGARLRGPHRL